MYNPKSNQGSSSSHPLQLCLLKFKVKTSKKKQEARSRQDYLSQEDGQS
jgi:hypothetical protein